MRETKLSGEIFTILEGSEIFLCLVPKGDVIFHFLLTEVLGGTLQTHKPHNENHEI